MNFADDMKRMFRLGAPTVSSSAEADRAIGRKKVCFVCQSCRKEHSRQVWRSP